MARDIIVQRGTQKLAYTDGSAATLDVAITLDGGVSAIGSSAFVRITSNGSFVPVVNKDDDFPYSGVETEGFTVGDMSATVELINDGGTAKLRFSHDGSTSTNTNGRTTEGDRYVSWELWEYVGSAGGANEFIVATDSSKTLTTASPLYAGSSEISSVTGATLSNSVTFQRGISWAKTGGGASDIPGEVYDYSEGNLVAYHDSIFGTDVFVVANGPGTIGSHSEPTLHYSTVCFTGSNWSAQKFTATGPGNATVNTLTTTSVDWTRAFIYSTRRSTGTSAQDHDLALWPSNATTLNYQYGADSSNSGDGNSLIAWVIENTGGGMFTQWYDHTGTDHILTIPSQWFDLDSPPPIYQDGARFIGAGSAGDDFALADVKPDMLTAEGGAMLNITRSDASNNTDMIGAGVIPSRYEFAAAGGRDKIIVPFAFGHALTDMGYLFGGCLISFSETEDPIDATSDGTVTVTVQDPEEDFYTKTGPATTDNWEKSGRPAFSGWLADGIWDASTSDSTANYTQWNKNTSGGTGGYIYSNPGNLRRTYDKFDGSDESFVRIVFDTNHVISSAPSMEFTGSSPTRGYGVEYFSPTTTTTDAEGFTVMTWDMSGESDWTGQAEVNSLSFDIIRQVGSNSADHYIRIKEVSVYTPTEQTAVTDGAYAAPDMAVRTGEDGETLDFGHGEDHGWTLSNLSVDSDSDWNGQYTRLNVTLGGTGTKAITGFSATGDFTEFAGADYTMVLERTRYSDVSKGLAALRFRSTETGGVNSAFISGVLKGPDAQGWYYNVHDMSGNAEWMASTDINKLLMYVYQSTATTDDYVDIDYIRIMKPTDAQAILSGLADATVTVNETADGTALFAGDADATVTVNETADGTGLFGGSSDGTLTVNETADGTALFAGDANVTTDIGVEQFTGGNWTGYLDKDNGNLTNHSLGLVKANGTTQESDDYYSWRKLNNSNPGWFSIGDSTENPGNNILPGPFDGDKFIRVTMRWRLRGGSASDIQRGLTRRSQTAPFTFAVPVTVNNLTTTTDSEGWFIDEWNVGNLINWTGRDIGQLQFFLLLGSATPGAEIDVSYIHIEAPTVGNALFAGDADATVTVNETADGTGLFGGSADGTITTDETAQAARIAGLEADATVTVDETADGTGLFGGSADATVTVDETADPTRIAGLEADATITVDEAADGTGLFGGSADAAIDHVLTNSGQFIAGGSADADVTVTESADSQRIAGGSAESSITITETVDATRILGAAVDSNITITETATGQVIQQGSNAANPIIIIHAVDTTGNIAHGGSVSSDVTHSQDATGSAAFAGNAAPSVETNVTQALAQAILQGEATGSVDIEVTPAVGSLIASAIADGTITILSDPPAAGELIPATGDTLIFVDEVIGKVITVDVATAKVLLAESITATQVTTDIITATYVADTTIEVTAKGDENVSAQGGRFTTIT